MTDMPAGPQPMPLRPPEPGPLRRVLDHALRESGALALLVTDQGGMLIDQVGPFGSAHAQSLAVLAVCASEASNGGVAGA